MNEKFKNLSELIGQGINIEESPKSIKKHEEQIFMEILDNLCQVEAINSLLEPMGIIVKVNNNPYIRATRVLMEKVYGQIKTEITLWWVFESISPDGEIYPLIDENGKKHVLKTPQQLYKFLKQYDGK